MFEARSVGRFLVEADMSHASGPHPVISSAARRCCFGFFAPDALVRRLHCAQDERMDPDRSRGATRKP
jgi:hypothetical protein